MNAYNKTKEGRTSGRAGSGLDRRGRVLTRPASGALCI